MEQRYEILDLIATGGMAEIYRARVFGAGGFEKKVVVKKILPAYTRDEEFVEMFIEEAKLAGTLQHGNIVQVYDLGVADGEYFIVMEYVNGRDLGDLMHYAGQRNVPVDLREAVYVVRQVCAGLDYAHRKLGPDGKPLGIIHRDISPQNVLLSYEGEVKLTDFGIAKAKTRVQRTQVGFLKGKYGYMSPEQARAQPLDNRSDVFNVGILLYELLVGERLFIGSSDFSTLNMMRNAAIKPPSKVKSDLPEGLEAIVMKALAAKPEDRFQSAGEMERALTRFSFEMSLVATAGDVARLMERVFGKPRTDAGGAKGTRVIALAALPSAVGPGEAGEKKRPRTIALGPASKAKPTRADSGNKKRAKSEVVDEAPPPAPEPEPEPEAPKPSKAKSSAAPAPEKSRAKRRERDGASRAAPRKPRTRDDETSRLPARSSTEEVRGGPARPSARTARRAGVSLPLVALVYLLCLALPFGGLAYAFWPDDEGALPVLREVEAERRARQAEAAGTETRRAPHAPEALIVVDTDVPGAVVSVDGVRAEGSAPLLVPVDPNAEVALEVTSPGHQTWRGSARIADGARVARVSAELGPETGRLFVASRPRGADVFVNGERAGTAPTRIDDLPRGEHRVRLTAEGHGPWEGVVDLDRGVARLNVQLVPERQMGRLEVVTATPPVRLLVDGDRVLLPAEGETLAVASGARRIRVEGAGGVSRDYRVEVPAGGRVRLFVDLSGDAGG
jgi:serine/threonine protein kinase